MVLTSPVRNLYLMYFRCMSLLLSGQTFLVPKIVQYYFYTKPFLAGIHIPQCVIGKYSVHYWYSVRYIVELKIDYK